MCVLHPGVVLSCDSLHLASWVGAGHALGGGFPPPFFPSLQVALRLLPWHFAARAVCAFSDLWVGLRWVLRRLVRSPPSFGPDLT